MRKIIAVILCILIILSLGACTSKQTKPQVQTQINTPTNKIDPDNKPILTSAYKDWKEYRSYSAVEGENSVSTNYCFKVPFQDLKNIEGTRAKVFVKDNKYLFFIPQEHALGDVLQLNTLHQVEEGYISKLVCNFFAKENEMLTMSFTSTKQININGTIMQQYVGDIFNGETKKYNIMAYAIQTEQNLYAMWIMIEETTGEEQTMSNDSKDMARMVAYSYKPIVQSETNQTSQGK